MIIYRFKLDYTNEKLSRNHWINGIDDFQYEIERRLTKTLLNKIHLEPEYELAKRKVLRLYNVKLPDVCHYNFEYWDFS
ncbi:DUF29 family protein [Crocosphaera sp. Alani8]|uniref:DUF29 family protein n=1 Tax=Crocosphaera sp. Alani8 TaxID=3038952 RepID=UPI00313DE4BC